MKTLQGQNKWTVFSLYKNIFIVIILQKALPKETATTLVLQQARLSHLENEPTAGTLENAAYTARFNEITKSFLAIVEELEI